jgi:acid phosphatase
MRRPGIVAVLAGMLLGVTGCSTGGTTSPPPSPSSPAPTSATAPAPSPSAISSDGTGRHVPAFAHVVIVVEENHGPSAALGMQYLASLRRTGATFLDSHGVAHPSEPNYLALWSGSTHGLTSDACPVDLGSAPSLGSQLLDSGRTVAGYAEGLPAPGSTACTAGDYARKHNPLADFTATAGAAHNLPFTAFPSDLGTLPAVSLVVPDLQHDAHDGSIEAADQWLHDELGAYAAWAPSHDSLLIVTFDESEGNSTANRILTVLTGAHVRHGAYREVIDHLRVLHTVESSFGLPLLGRTPAPITDVWQ